MAPRVLCILLAFAASFAIGTARAQQPAGEAVALLPLDAEAKLELYGQPVARELARALTAGGIAVAVVGPRMAVPAHARLIVDGNITAGKGGSVVLSIRIRNPVDGTVLETLASTATELATIDRAAAEIAGRVLPAVRDRLDKVRAGTIVTPPEVRDPPRAKPPEHDKQLVLLAVTTAKPAAEPFRVALGEAVTAWTLANDREPRTIDASTLVRTLAPQTVASSGAERALSFEVLSYSLTGADVPLARARVRVRIADGNTVQFDRVVVTDTVVGERQMAIDAVAARVAREVLTILRPHVRRVVGTWR